MKLRYDCTGCHRQLDPDELDEFGHVCDGWWDDHGAFDALPEISVSESTDPDEDRRHRDWLLNPVGLIRATEACAEPTE